MIETTTRADTTVIRIKHDIVASHLDTLREELREVVAQGNTRLALDLSEVSIVDSKGLAVLMACYKSVAAEGGALTLVTGDADLLKLFRMVRLDEYVAIVESVESL